MRTDANARAAGRLRLLDEIPRNQWWVVAVQMAFAVALAIQIGPRVVLPGSDFLGLWAAHQAPDPYDMVQVSRAAGVWLPYGHPPTFLLLTLPFRWLASFPAYLGWVAVSAAALVGAIRRPLGIAILGVPAVFTAAFIGQSSLAVGALLFLGFTLPSNPRLAGVCFGLAACIKPQLGLLAPLALIAAGSWRTILWATATGVAVAVAATATYGLSIWGDWLRSLPDFVKFTDAHVAAHYISVPGAWKVVPLVAGAVGVWRAGRRGDMLLAGAIAIAAALLGSMHAMTYEQALLAPFAAVAATERGRLGLPFLAFLACPLWPPAVALMGGYAFALSELGAPRPAAPTVVDVGAEP